jgi:curved DNA-binding protein CbpA
LDLPPNPHALQPEQVKANYKALARQLHPDKCGSRLNTQEMTLAFQALTNAYRVVMEEVRACQAESIEHMRKSFVKFANGQQNNSPQKPEKKKMTAEQFNANFEKERGRMGHDPDVDAGYASWINENDPDKAPPFKQHNNNQVVVRRNPEPMNMARCLIGVCELGIEQRSDFGNDADGYTDYQRAHTTTRLVTDADIAVADIDNKRFTDIKSYTRHRDNNSGNFTDEELAQMRIDDERAIQMENRRQEAMQKKDELIHRLYGGALGTA